MQCSLCKKLHIVPGCLDDYRGLAHYHYRDSKPGPYTAIFTLRPAGTWSKRLGVKVVGVIVYATPKPHVELRSIATGGLFAGLPRRMQLQLVNKNIRCISRVIIEPRFRGLGLAARLVRETMPLFNRMPRFTKEKRRRDKSASTATCAILGVFRCTSMDYSGQQWKVRL
jgi:hypothetical protein